SSDGGRATVDLTLPDKHPGRIPRRDGTTDHHVRAELQLHGDGLSVLLFELGRHEPGRNARPGGDGLPDFLRCAGDFEFDLEGTATVGFLLHAHCSCSLGSDFWGRGCAMTTRRWARPPGADASWYFETSLAMASESSRLNAARSL